MSILFDDASIQFAQRDETPVVSFPFAIACRIYLDDDTITQTLVCLTDRNSDVSYFALEVEAGGKIRAKTVGVNGRIELAITGTAITPNTWHHALGIWKAEADVEVYIDGVSQGTSPGSADGSGGINPPIFFDSSGGMAGPTGLDTITIGRLSTLVPANYTSGRIAEATIWDNSTALAADEINDLGPDKLDPLLVRTDEIVFHTPLFDVVPDPTIDIIGSLNLTLFNSPVVADHPPLQYFDPETYARFRSGPIEFNFTSSQDLLLQPFANWELTRPASNDLSFLQIVQTNVIQIHVQHNIGFDVSVDSRNTINVSLSHNLAFNQPFGPTIEDTASNSLAFTGAAFRAGDPKNSIDFVGTAVGLASKDMINSLLFGQSVAAQFDGTKLPSNSLALTQDVVAYIEP